MQTNIAKKNTDRTVVQEVYATTSGELLVSGTVAGGVASGAADSGNPVKVGGVYNSSLPVLTTGQRGDVQLDPGGNVRSRIVAFPQAGADGGSNTLAWAVRYDQSTTAALFAQASHYHNGSTWDRTRGDTNGAYVVNKPVTSGGLTAARVITGTTGVIKASAGQVYHLRAVNTNAAVRYLHLYNKATAPSLSTDTPIYTIPLQASSVPADVNLGNIGLAFSTGIAWAYTTDNASAPVTAATSGEGTFSVGYF